MISLFDFDAVVHANISFEPKIRSMIQRLLSLTGDLDIAWDLQIIKNAITRAISKQKNVIFKVYLYI